VRCWRRRSAHPGQHLARVEGLGNVIVGAQLQPQDLVGVLHPRREHDDRGGGQARVAADAAGHLPAVQVGQHQVEEKQVGALIAQHRQRCGAIARHLHRISRLLQIPAQQPRNLPIIVHHQNAFVAHPNSWLIVNG